MPSYNTYSIPLKCTTHPLSLSKVIGLIYAIISALLVIMDKVEVFPSITSIYQLAVKETVAVWSMKVFTKYAKTTQKKQNKPGRVYIKSVALT